MRNSIIVFLLSFSFLCPAQNLTALPEVHAKAISYLNASSDTVSFTYNLRLLYAHILSKYNFRNKINLNQLNFIPKTPEDIDASVFYTPLIDINYGGSNADLIKKYESSLDYDHFILWGLYPNQLPWDSVCQALWNEILLPGCNVRRTAHAALGYYLAKDALNKSFKEKLEKDIPAIVKNLLISIPIERPETDNGLEGILALILFEKQSEIRSRWISDIIDKQLQDGGWAWDGKANNNSHPHPTVLALWVLSEVKSRSLSIIEK
jgi:hypothetical protein